VTNEAPTDPYVNFIAGLLFADEVTEEGVFAICAALARKGIFEENDICFVLRFMREAAERLPADDVGRPGTLKRLEDRERDLVALLKPVTIDPPEV
jgi:hypothetical protein